MAFSSLHVVFELPFCHLFVGDAFIQLVVGQKTNKTTCSRAKFSLAKLNCKPLDSVAMRTFPRLLFEDFNQITFIEKHFVMI